MFQLSWITYKNLQHFWPDIVRVASGNIYVALKIVVKNRRVWHQLVLDKTAATLQTTAAWKIYHISYV